ncbi:neutral zinc metallopeptidase [Nocardia asteroides]|uniref:neutral zinc metallopeptidase n=1 Tax=Nocardia asteroides TaxID=1824 RepID=UPI001E40E023|nr:neutral zinc metallopeptidase [Nocardia asteroides]UGT60810.1 neutral zinc metallopeptidase [Nocardia asteroides]
MSGPWWSRPRRLIALAAGAAVIGLVLAAGVSGPAHRTVEPPTELRAARGVAAGPGFAGVLDEAARPAGDDAPPVAELPLAGVPLRAGPGAPDPRPVFALADHPLLARHAGLARISCELPPWHDEPRGADAFLRATLDCLDDSWSVTLRNAGLPFRPPRLELPAAGARSACPDRLPGPADRPFYCPAEESIVVPAAALRPLGAGSRRGTQLAALGHEYGHHVQQLVGVLRAYTDARTAAGWSSERGQEQSRRLDLQAWCLSGMFLGTNHGRGDIDRRTWEEAASAVRAGGDRPGEPRLLGSPESVWGWWRWGSDTGDTWECNSWYAAASHVG